MNVILLGPPGAGKGTQARFLRDKYKASLVSTGEILRKEIQNKTSIGLRVKEAIESGQYPSDNIIIEVLENHFQNLDLTKGVILDGVPRTLNQALKIDEIFHKLNLTLDKVIELKVDDQLLIKRIGTRVVCRDCGEAFNNFTKLPKADGICDSCGNSKLEKRQDDNSEFIKTRLDIYNERTKPLLAYYQQDGRLQTVDGMRSIIEVSSEISKLINDSEC